MKHYTYNLISKFRNELFGIAIIMIVIFHYMADAASFGTDYYRPIVLASKIWMRVLGSIGVELFVFLSGMGLYYSMSKNANVLSFYKKRVSRILFPYLIVGIPFWIYRDVIVQKLSMTDFLKDYFFITFWTKGTRNLWYIGFILAIYAAFPWIYRLIQNTNDSVFKRNVIILTGMVLAMTFGLAVLNPILLQNTEIAISRLLVFNLGLLFAPAIKQSRKIRWHHVLGMICGVVSCTLLKRLDLMQGEKAVLGRWRSAFLAILLILVLTYLLQFIVKVNMLDRLLCWFGKYTLEIYLLHVTFRGVLKMNHIYTGYLHNYAIMIAITLVLSPVLSLINSKISDKIMHKKQ